VWNYGGRHELEARVLVGGRLLDERGWRRAGAFIDIGEDTRPRIDHHWKVAPDVTQEERLTDEIPERSLLRGKERRQRPISGVSLIGWFW
jgi:hypothetical protein